MVSVLRQRELGVRRAGHHASPLCVYQRSPDSGVAASLPLAAGAAAAGPSGTQSTRTLRSGHLRIARRVARRIGQRGLESDVRSAAFLNREKPCEKGSVPSQRDAKIFSRDVLAAVPLLLEFLAFAGEDFG